MANAIGYGNGRVKQKDWDKFLSAFDNKEKSKADPVKTLKQMKLAGLPIEEK